MTYAPIILFVYNRADHFLKVYNSLAECYEAKYSDLYIFSDGAKNETDKSKVNVVRAELSKIKTLNEFNSMTIIESEENKGLAKSVISGVTEVINKYGKVIVVEDDCVVSPYYLNYMNKCLDFYGSNKKIGSISGYSPVISFPEDYKDDVFLAYRSCSWSWATWKDRWNDVDWDLKEIKDFYKNPSLIKRLNANGNDRFLRLYRQTKGNGSSWSVRFGAHLSKNELHTVYPRYSYCQNIGCDETGVHSKSDDAEKMNVELNNAIDNPTIMDVSINADIQKLMKKHYFDGFVSDIKRFVATVLIVITERLKGIVNGK